MNIKSLFGIVSFAKRFKSFYRRVFPVYHFAILFMGSSNSKYLPFKLSQIRFWQIWAMCLHSIFIFVCRKVPDKSDQSNKKSDQNLSFNGNNVGCRKLFTKSDQTLFSAPSFPLTGYEIHPLEKYSKSLVFPKFLCSPVNISLEKGGGKEKDKCRQLPKAAFLIISLGHCGHKALRPCINEPGKTFPKFYTKATVYLFNR